MIVLSCKDSKTINPPLLSSDFIAEDAAIYFSSNEELAKILENAGFTDGEIRSLFEEDNDDLNFRSGNCSCYDDAVLYEVERENDFFFVKPSVTTYQPEIWVKIDQYTCDRTTILSSFSIQLSSSSLQDCYYGIQIGGILNWSTAACLPGCSDPTLYDLTFTLEKGGNQCDQIKIYGVECP